jgi:hypothetical protein
VKVDLKVLQLKNRQYIEEKHVSNEVQVVFGRIGLLNPRRAKPLLEELQVDKIFRVDGKRHPADPEAHALRCRGVTIHHVRPVHELGGRVEEGVDARGIGCRQVQQRGRRVEEEGAGRVGGVEGAPVHDAVDVNIVPQELGRAARDGKQGGARPPRLREIRGRAELHVARPPKADVALRPARDSSTEKYGAVRLSLKNMVSMMGV